MTGYQIQGIHSNFSSVSSIIDVEVAKIATNFLTFLVTCSHSNAFDIGVIFNMAQVLWRLLLVLLCYLGNINLSSWMAFSTTLLVFFESLSLRLISRRRIVGLSLVFILGSLIAGLLIGILLVFLHQQAMTFWVLGIDFPNVEGWLQVSLCFYITCFHHYFFPRI